MGDSDWAAERAEEYWRLHAEPVLKRVVIDAFLSGTAVVPPALANWLASAPIGRGAEAVTPPPPPEPAQQVPPGAKEVAAPQAGPRPKRSPRPLKGVSAAAYDLVKRAGKPLTSRELLGQLRDWDGGERTEARDNSLLAAMRRLRKAGWVDFDGTHYSPSAKRPRSKGRSDPAGPGRV